LRDSVERAVRGSAGVTLRGSAGVAALRSVSVGALSLSFGSVTAGARSGPDGMDGDAAGGSLPRVAGGWLPRAGGPP